MGANNLRGDLAYAEFLYDLLAVNEQSLKAVGAIRREVGRCLDPYLGTLEIWQSAGLPLGRQVLGLDSTYSASESGEGESQRDLDSVIDPEEREEFLDEWAAEEGGYGDDKVVRRKKLLVDYAHRTEVDSASEEEGERVVED